MPASDATLRILAYRTAARVSRNPLLAEEAAEQALFRLHVANLAGHGPDCPEAWIRTVTRRSVFALLRHGWARTQALTDPERTPVPPSEPDRGELREQLRRRLSSVLTHRQQQALEAALTSATMREAARTCAMAPRDFRRYMAAIARHARTHLALDELAGCWRTDPGGG